MGRVAASVDNAVIESIWSTMRRERLDRQRWSGRAEPGSAIVEWIEASSTPSRRHSAVDYLSPIQFEDPNTAALAAARSPHRTCPEARAVGGFFGGIPVRRLPDEPGDDVSRS